MDLLLRPNAFTTFTMLLLWGILRQDELVDTVKYGWVTVSGGVKGDTPGVCARYVKNAYG